MSISQDDLYVVVHHRRDPDQRWSNSWRSDEELEAIQTTATIGRLCEEAKLAARAVYIDRCAWDANPPLVCCRAIVRDALEIDRSTWLVQFCQQPVLAESPPEQPGRGQKHYFGEC
jgi:hypothetical protein